MGESLGSTGFPAFDRLIGGAVRAGKIYFLLAEPGVGKTTLLLQTAANIAGDAVKVLFFTGEMTESAMREMGARFGVADRMPEIMVNKDTRELASIVRAERPAVVMVDSLQTLIGEGTKRLTYEEQTHTALVIRKLAQEATTA
jgi:DNA repair protein RadA/Sms